jgi:hypothetical protein
MGHRPDRRRNVPPPAPARRDVDCRRCGIPVVILRDAGGTYRVLDYGTQSRSFRSHACPEHPAYKAQKLLNQSKRLLASAKMTPSQRRDLVALIEKLEGGAM